MVLPQLPNYPLTNSPDLRQTALGRERQLAGSEAVNLPVPRAKFLRGSEVGSTCFLPKLCGEYVLPTRVRCATSW